MHCQKLILPVLRPPDLTRILELEPDNKHAAAKLRALEPTVEAKREALKKEMLGAP